MANNPIKYSDLIQYTDDIEKLIKQLTDADAAYTTLSQHIKTQAKSIQSDLKMVSGATEEGRKKIAQAAAAAEKLAETDKAVAAADKEVVKAKEQLVKVSKEVVDADIAIIRAQNNAKYSALGARSGYIDLDNAVKRVMSRDYASYIDQQAAGMERYSKAINVVHLDMRRLNVAQQQLQRRYDLGEISDEGLSQSLQDLQMARSKISSYEKPWRPVYSDAPVKKVVESTVGTSELANFRQLDSTLQELAQNYQRAHEESASLRSTQKQLNKEYQEGAVTQEQYTERSAALSIAISKASDDEKELSQRIKLRRKALDAMEGSYNALSARYSEITRELNAMGNVEGEELKRKEALTAEAAELIEKMKALKDAVGNNQLEVGSYEKAINAALDSHTRFRTRTQDVKEAMMQLRLEGKENTEEYRTLAAEAGRLRDIQADVDREVRGLASDTSALDGVLGALSVGSGALSSTVGLMNLWGGGSEDVAEAQRKLQAAIAVTTGLQSIQNATQKQSALMLGISKIQTLALTAAQKIQAKVTAQNTTATVAQTVAMKALNLVAKANPWVLLATGIGLAGAALFAFTDDTKEAKRNLEQQRKSIDDMVAAQHNFQGVLKAHGAVQSELYAAELRNLNVRYTVQSDYYNKIKRLYKDDEEEYKDALEAKTATTQEFLDKLGEVAAYYGQQTRDAKNADYRATNGPAAADLAELQERVEKYNLSLDNALAEASRLNTKLNAEYDAHLANAAGKTAEAIEVRNQTLRLFGHSADWYADAAAEARRQATEVHYQIEQVNDYIRVLQDAQANRGLVEEEERRQLADKLRQYRSNELKLIRAAEDEKDKYMTDGYDRQRHSAEVAARRRIEDLRIQLSTEKTLTAAGRQAIANTILSIERNLSIQLTEINETEAANRIKLEREVEDAIIGAMRDSDNKQREQLRVSYERQIEDLQRQLVTARDISTEEATLLFEKLLALQEQYDAKRTQLEESLAANSLSRQQQAYELQLAGTRENTEEYLRLRREAIRKEEEMELAKNAALDKDQQQSESDIHAKYDKKYAEESLSIMMSIFDQQQEYEAAAFNATVHTEEERTEFELQQQVKRLEQMREYYRQLGLLTAEQEKYINDLIAGAYAQNADSKRPTLGNGMLGSLLGKEGFNVELSDNAVKGINATDMAIEQSMSLIGEYISAWQELAQAKVDAANQEVEAAQRVVDYEMQARANGYANNVALAQQELDEKKKLQQEALKEQQKAQKAEEAINTTMQMVNLITASTQIFKAVSGLGVFGVPLAVTLIGTMFAAFAAAKIKAAQATKASTEEYGDGTVELLRGGSHSSGHDIDLGTKPDGTRRRAEGGEFFAIINKRSSRRFRSLIPGVIDSLNKGDFPERYMRMYDASRLQLAVAGGGGTDISRVERDLHAIRKRGETRQYVDGRGNTVIITGSRTRRIINK